MSTTIEEAREYLEAWKQRGLDDPQHYRFQEILAAIIDDAEAWRKGVELLRELRERAIPCGHRIEDLIGGEGTVTKCGACLAQKMAAKNG